MSRMHQAAASWPLVGRDEELAFIRETLRRRPPPGLVIAGAAGVGKTRLAAEALQAAVSIGYAAASATATRSAAAIPFGALAPLLPQPETRGRRPVEVLRRAGAALAERAGGRPLVLAVDDVQLLDDASATLVHQLATTRTVVVVVTMRTEEMLPDAIVALWKEGLAEYLELQPLARADVERLVAEVLGGDVDGTTLHGLWSATRGNVLFLRELIVGGLERDALVETGGLWRWRGPIASGSRLQELIESRLGRIDAEQRKLLEAVAIGEPLGTSAIERFGSLEAVELLQRRGLFGMERDGRRVQHRLAHPLYAEAIRARTPPLRARRVQQQLADALEATGARRREDLLRLATWRLESGGRAASEILLAAARQAQASFDAALAERLARAAGDAGGGFAADHTLARALLRQGRFREANELFARLEAAAEGKERVAVAEARARNLLWGLGMADEAEAVVVRAERALTGPHRDELTALRGWLLCFRGRPSDALAVLLPLFARDPTGESLSIRVSVGAANALAMAGRTDEAIALADRWRPAALQLAAERPFFAILLESVRFLALWVSGRYAEAADLTEQGYPVVIQRGTQEATAAFAAGRGAVALGEGRIGTAVRWLRESALLFREFDPIGFLPWALAWLAQASGQLGDSLGADAAVTEAEDVRRPGMHMFDVDLALARAWTSAARGELSEARARALAAADRAEAHGQNAFAVISLHDLARLGDPHTAAPRLAAVAEKVDGPLARPCADHAAALVSRDAAALEAAAAAFEATGALLRAAEAASAAATAYREVGRHANARAASARAAMLAASCEGARTPGLAADSALDELTDREREVAALAASGLSNGEIATRLVVSVRTVENHLQHVYGKLGVTSRRDLGPLLRPPAPAGSR